MIYALCLVLFIVGLYGVLVKRNLVKIIIGLGVVQSSIILFIVMLGYTTSGADPLIHEIALAAIVMGIAVIALAVSIARRLHEKHGTYDIRDISRFKD